MDKEDLCNRCGRCCHLKVKIGDDLVISDIACPYLHPESHLCIVYERRFDFNPHCATREVALANRLAPDDCGYAYDGYIGAREPRSEGERMLVNIIAQRALEALEWGPVKGGNRKNTRSK